MYVQDRFTNQPDDTGGQNGCGPNGGGNTRPCVLFEADIWSQVHYKKETRIVKRENNMSHFMTADHCALLFIDWQERLFPAMEETVRERNLKMQSIYTGWPVS